MDIERQHGIASTDIFVCLYLCLISMPQTRRVHIFQLQFCCVICFGIATPTPTGDWNPTFDGYVPVSQPIPSLPNTFATRVLSILAPSQMRSPWTQLVVLMAALAQSPLVVAWSFCRPYRSVKIDQHIVVDFVWFILCST